MNDQTLCIDVKIDKPQRFWYQADYKEANTGLQYRGGLFATNVEEAGQLAEKRGLGEQVFPFGYDTQRPYELPSDLFARWFDKFFGNPEYRSRWGGSFNREHAMNDPEFRHLNGEMLHGCVWIGYLALKAGVATVDEVLSDRGIIHSATHLSVGILDNYLGTADQEAKGLRELLPLIEARVPGLT